MTGRDPRTTDPDRSAPGEPQRLVHDREIGALLTRANAAYRSGLDETGAFQRLTQRQETPERSWRWQGLTFGAVLSVAAGLILVLGVFDDAPSQMAMGPEVSAGRRPSRTEPLAGERPSSGGVEASGAEASGEDVRSPLDAARVARRLSSENARLAGGGREGSAVETLDDAARPPHAAPAERDTTGSRTPAAVRDEPADGSDESAREASDEAPQRSLERATRGLRTPSERRAPSAERRADELIVDAPAAPAEPAPAPRSDRAQGDARDGVDTIADRAKGDVDDPAATRETVPARSAGDDGATAGAATGSEAASATRAAVARLDCSDMLNEDAQAAEHCYALRAAESSGLSAEAALYELARVRRDVRRDAKGALAALNDYRDRFPQGSLRNEVGLSRVEILSELGRSREALNESDALLRSGKGRERAAELYLLRGGIFRRDLSDYAQAAQEYAKAEAFGGAVGAEATRLRGLSLEALGDVEGALAAYRRYLSGPEQPRKSEVNRRIEALTANQRGKVP